MDITKIKPFVKKNFLSEEEYASVYETINKYIEKNKSEGKDAYDEPFNKLGNNGFIVYFDMFEKPVLDRFKSGLEELIGHEIHKPGILFCRYTKDSGFSPRLLPHCDRAMKFPAVTTTIELNTTLDWDIYVEHEKFNLDKNDILVFSGSHNMHWRPHTEFNDSDYFDIIICQSTLVDPESEELTEEHFAAMDMRSQEFIKQYFDLLEPSLGDRGGSR
jgi:hypothetical protein